MLARWLQLFRAPRPATNLGPDSALPVDREMMARALALAEAASTLQEVPVGAVVYDHTTGQIIGEAHNRRESDHDPAAHAELIAIRSAAAALGDWRLNHLSLAVTLEPCCMCAGTIINARVGRVIFAARDPKAGFCGSLHSLTQHPKLNHRVQPIEGVLAEESAALLKSFFKARRTKKT